MITVGVLLQGSEGRGEAGFEVRVLFEELPCLPEELSSQLAWSNKWQKVKPDPTDANGRKSNLTPQMLWQKVKPDPTDAS